MYKYCRSMFLNKFLNNFSDPFKVHFENQLREEQIKKDYAVIDVKVIIYML